MASCAQVSSLLQAHIDKELSPAEAAILEQHLSDCRLCSAEMRRQRASSALLFEVFEPKRLQQNQCPQILAHLPEMDRTQRLSHEVTWRAKHPPKRAAWFLTVMPAMALLVLFVLGIAIVTYWPDANLAGKVVGMVTYQEGHALSSSEESTNRHRVALKTMILQDETIETRENGKLIIGLAGPTQMKLDGDTRVKIENERKINVETGRIWLDVSKDERLFRVTTPSGDITVYGTAFSVEVTENSTIIIVEEGKVQASNDITFAELQADESLEMSLGERHLVKQTVDAKEWTRWAAEIQPNMDALALFEAKITRPSGGTVIPAEQVFVVKTSNRPVRAITFEWTPDIHTLGHSGYFVYVYDDHMQPLFKTHINAETFSDKHSTSMEIVIPDDVPVADITVMHIKVDPDESTGLIQTSFVEVYALQN